MKPASQSGFTLVETLVALFILALISTAGSSLLLGAYSSGKQIREQEQGARQLDIAMAFVRGDIGAMTARAVRPEWGGGAGNLFGGPPSGDEPFLRFVRNGWIVSDPAAARSSLQYVSYALRDGRLVRIAQVRPDGNDQTERIERVLLEDVARIEIRFRRGEEWSDRWIGDAGQALAILPDLVELDVHFENETALTIAAIGGARL